MRNRLDHEKVDSWIRENPTKSYKEIIGSGFSMSKCYFYMLRKKLLRETGETSSSKPGSMYMAVYSTAIKSTDNDSIRIVKEMIAALNKSKFDNVLETVVIADPLSIELRRIK
jgi:hypothetical protein